MYKLLKCKIIEIIDESDDFDYISSLKEEIENKENENIKYIIEKEIFEPVF